MNRHLRAHRIVAALLLSCSFLSADEVLAQSPGLRALEGQPEAPKLTARKSPWAAVGAAVGTSLASWSLVTISMSVSNPDDAEGLAFLSIAALASSAAPSVGHFYTGEYRRGLLTTGLRLGLYSAAVGFAYALSREIQLDNDASDDKLVGYFYTSLGLAAAGVGLSIYDMIDAGFSARRVNASQAALAPMVLGDRNGINGGGAMLSVSF